MRTIDQIQGETVRAGGQSLWFGGVLFLALNFTARAGVLFTGTPLMTQFIGIAGIAICLLPLYRPSLLKAVLFSFALTFPLYGSFPYGAHSFLFDLYVSCLSLTLTVNLSRSGAFIRGNRTLRNVLFLYVLFSCSSFLLLPVRDIGWRLILWDWNVFWDAVYFATPELPLYSVAAMNRLILYALFAVLLASCREARELYRAVFAALCIAAFWASAIGIINYYDLLELHWFRRDHADWARLQSVFANPGWFAEFVTVSVPYAAAAFIGSVPNRAIKFSLLGMIAVCQVAILLTYSRAGWVIYPLVLIACWVFFYLAGRGDTGRESWKKSVKVLFRVIVSVFLIAGIGYFLLVLVSGVAEPLAAREKSKIHQRLIHMTDPSVRKVIWRETIELIGKKPLFGLGYESFKQHNSILKRVKMQWDTPHNLYLQMMVSGGIAGLVLWGILISAALYLLVADLVKNRSLLNIPVIMSVTAFHLYGLFQAMQYIPMIWFLVFLGIGYALTVNGNVLPARIQGKQGVVAAVLLPVVLAGMVVYALDFESRGLARKEKLTIHSLDQERESYKGFYAAERWKGRGIFRWSGSGAIIDLPRAALFELTFVCGAPDLAGSPLVLSVYDGDREIDTIYFFQQESVTRQYYLPEAEFADKRLFLHVSRTWSLKKLGVADDSRHLGVAVSRVRVVRELPADGIGFYNREIWQGRNLPGRDESQFHYRWTGREAVFHPRRLSREQTLYFRAGQPGLPDNPLAVAVMQQGRTVKSFRLADAGWHRVDLRGLLDKDEPCIIRVSRTWNPKIMDAGDDRRTLGVAVAGLERGRLPAENGHN